MGNITATVKSAFIPCADEGIEDEKEIKKEQECRRSLRACKGITRWVMMFQ